MNSLECTAERNEKPRFVSMALRCIYFSLCNQLPSFNHRSMIRSSDGVCPARILFLWENDSMRPFPMAEYSPVSRWRQESPLVRLFQGFPRLSSIYQCLLRRRVAAGHRRYLNFSTSYFPSLWYRSWFRRVSRSHRSGLHHFLCHHNLSVSERGSKFNFIFRFFSTFPMHLNY